MATRKRLVLRSRGAKHTNDGHLFACFAADAQADLLGIAHDRLPRRVRLVRVWLFHGIDGRGLVVYGVRVTITETLNWVP